MQIQKLSSPSPNPAQPQLSQTQIPISSNGTGADTKILHHPTHHPITFRRSGWWEYIVQREALSTPECQDSVLSQGGQQK